MKWRQVFVPVCLLVVSTACVTVQRRGGWFSDWTDWNVHLGWDTAGGFWLLANFAYGGMRAQGSRENPGWRVLAFIFGFPGTLVSLACVIEGSERAYGVDLPRRARPTTAQSISDQPPPPKN